MDPLSLRMASLALLSSPVPLLASIPRPNSLPALHRAILEEMPRVIEFCQNMWLGLQTAGFDPHGTTVLAHRLLRASTGGLWAAWTQELAEPHARWSGAICILLRFVQLGPFRLPLPASPEPPPLRAVPQAQVLTQASRHLTRTSPAVLRRLQRPLVLNRAPRVAPGQRRPRWVQVLEVATSATFFPQGLDADDSPDAHIALLTAARLLASAAVSHLWFATILHSTSNEHAQPWGAAQTLLLWTLATAPDRGPDPWASGPFSPGDVAVLGAEDR